MDDIRRRSSVCMTSSLPEKSWFLCRLPYRWRGSLEGRLAVNSDSSRLGIISYPAVVASTVVGAVASWVFNLETEDPTASEKIENELQSGTDRRHPSCYAFVTCHGPQSDRVALGLRSVSQPVPWEIVSMHLP